MTGQGLQTELSRSTSPGSAIACTNWMGRGRARSGREGGTAESGAAATRLASAKGCFSSTVFPSSDARKLLEADVAFLSSASSAPRRGLLQAPEAPDAALMLDEQHLLYVSHGILTAMQCAGNCQAGSHFLRCTFQSAAWHLPRQ